MIVDVQPPAPRGLRKVNAGQENLFAVRRGRAGDPPAGGSGDQAAPEEGQAVLGADAACRESIRICGVSGTDGRTGSNLAG